MRRSWLFEGGANLFQEIKEQTAAAEQRGVKILKLSIGQPQGPALLSAREAAAKAVMSDAESMHEYQDNGSPGVPNFAERFVQAHLRSSPLDTKRVDFLPIPGIKPMLGLIPLACGFADRIKVATTTRPGYPTPRDWCRGYLGLTVNELYLGPENNFLFTIGDLDLGKVQLVMMNYPHNPTGQIATRDWLEALCQYCAKHDIRLFNDAAYYALSYGPKSVCLAEVAVRFSGLSWAEAFSASKLIGNGTGWRVGAIVGSPDFVADIKTIKGNTDSGFVAPMAAGVIHAVENDSASIKKVAETYRRRSQLLVSLLRQRGMQLAVEPRAGFFTLWKVPKRAFGENVQDAKQFNFMMIERTGVVGVHFHPYIRYAVCGDVEAMAGEIDEAFKKANVSYD
jgi:LL-diaminopimelate aminotransferase